MSGPGVSEIGDAEVAVSGSASVRLIRFVDVAQPGDVVLARFTDPAARCAVLTPQRASSPGANEVDGDELEVVLLAPGELAKGLGNGQDAEVSVKLRGAELRWRPGRAVLECDADQVEALLPALAEFAHYEGELRRIEHEIAQGWAELEEDKALAFEVTSSDLYRSDEVGARMAATLGRRMRLARMEAHLFAPDTALGVAGQRLGAALREQTHMETRAETVDGQLEVFEHVYEMGAQRMGEYRAARHEGILEWVIIVLLAAEAVLMGLQALWSWLKL